LITLPLVKLPAETDLFADFYDSFIFTVLYRNLKPLKPNTMYKKETIIREEQPLHANVGEHIGYELGAKMIKDYFDKYQESGSQFVGRNILEQILAQPGCIGIQIYKGLNETGQKSYVLTGVNKDGHPILEITAVNPNGEIKKEEGIVADRNVEKIGWFGIDL
jgi:hypothetical protein